MNLASTAAGFRMVTEMKTCRCQESDLRKASHEWWSVCALGSCMATHGCQTFGVAQCDETMILSLSRGLSSSLFPPPKARQTPSGSLLSSLLPSQAPSAFRGVEEIVSCNSYIASVGRIPFIHIRQQGWAGPGSSHFISPTLFLAPSYITVIVNQAAGRRRRAAEAYIHPISVNPVKQVILDDCLGCKIQHLRWNPS